MDTFLLIFMIVTASTYLLMQRRLTDLILGFALLSNGAVLILLFTTPDPEEKAAPIVTEAISYVDPLPQALILTAIVIGFGLTAFMIVLAFRLFGYYGSLTTDKFIDE